MNYLSNILEIIHIITKIKCLLPKENKHILKVKN